MQQLQLHAAGAQCHCMLPVCYRWCSVHAAAGVSAAGAQCLAHVSVSVRILEGGGQLHVGHSLQAAQLAALPDGVLICVSRQGATFWRP